MVHATMFEAKTRLSELVKQAQKGETIIITSGRERKPVAKLEAIEPLKKKRLGVREEEGFVLSDSFGIPCRKRSLQLGKARRVASESASRYTYSDMGRQSAEASQPDGGSDDCG